MAMVASSSAGGGAGWWWLAASWGSGAAGENRALIMVMAGDGGVSRCHLVQDIAFCSRCLPTRATSVETPNPES
jgi:hypothetical protein